MALVGKASGGWRRSIRQLRAGAERRGCDRRSAARGVAVDFAAGKADETELADAGGISKLVGALMALADACGALCAALNLPEAARGTRPSTQRRTCCGACGTAS